VGQWIRTSATSGNGGDRPQRAIIKPTKAKSNEKIDDYCALVNAIAVSLGEESSPYSDGRGLLVI
jgi:hypothetical protein